MLKSSNLLYYTLLFTSKQYRTMQHKHSCTKLQQWTGQGLFGQLGQLQLILGVWPVGR